MADPVILPKRMGRPKGVKNNPLNPQRNITLDADLNDRLNAICDLLGVKLGFRPTLSQGLRHLIAMFEKENPPK